jgi:hypothetical protein
MPGHAQAPIAELFGRRFHQPLYHLKFRQRSIPVSSQNARAGASYAPSESMMDDCHVLRQPLSDSVWHAFFLRALRFANRQVAYFRSRGEFGGLLPSGYDANSIASQATAQLWQATHPNALADNTAARTQPGIPNLRQAPPPGPCPPRRIHHSNSPFRPAARATANPALYSCPANGQPRLQDGRPWHPGLPLTRQCRRCVNRRLWRLVHRLIDALHHRKENFLLRNHLDLPLIPLDDGELIDPINNVPDPDPDPAQTLAQNEKAAQLENLKARLRAFLAHDPQLRDLLACCFSGVCKPKAIAAKLALPRPKVKNLLRRLHRKITRFKRASTLPPR